MIDAIRRDIERHAAAYAHARADLLDPWALLLALEGARRDVCSPAAGARIISNNYAQFITLTSRWPLADQDALLYAARPIFHVTIPVMRRDLATVTLAHGDYVFDKPG